jgi:hypothetical protein
MSLFVLIYQGQFNYLTRMQGIFLRNLETINFFVKQGKWYFDILVVEPIRCTTKF